MTQMPSLPSTPPRNNDIDLRRFFGNFLQYKWWILAITLVFTAWGWGYGQLSIPIYQGDALVQIERRGTVNPLADAMGSEGDDNAMAEVRILSSRMVLGQVVDQTDIDTLVQPRRLPLIGEYVQRNGIERPNPEEHPVIGWLLSRLPFDLLAYMSFDEAVWGHEWIQVTELDTDDRYRNTPITLRVASPLQYRLYLGEELLGEGMVGRLEAFMDGALSVRVGEIRAPARSEFALTKLSRTAAIGSLRSRLEVIPDGGRSGSTGIITLLLRGEDRAEIDSSLNAITRTFLMQNVERQSEEADKRLRFLEEQAPSMRETLTGAENRLNEYRVQAGSVDLSSESSSLVSRLIELEERLNELEVSQEEMSMRYTRHHPAYQSLMRQRTRLLEERERLNARIDEMPGSQQEIIRLTRDVEVAQSIYVSMLNRAQELQVSRAGIVGNIRIIDNAHVGGGPIFPNRKLMLLLYSFLGVLLGVAFAVVRGLMSRGIETSQQLEEAGLPVYATIPQSDSQQKLVRRIHNRRRKYKKNVIYGTLATANPTDGAVEALRSLRTSLHFAMVEAKSNSIMITGPTMELGKSFTTINLAATCAQGSQRVLVIDADMRKGHIHDAFKGSPELGLSELLSGQVECQDAVRHTHIEGLEYISRGKVPPNPSELLMQKRFSSLIDELSAKYDLVIIDTPPILAVTDATIVGKVVGTSLMITRFQVTTQKEVEAALRKLETAGVRVRGAILNGIERRLAKQYGYQYYSYSYR
ncbi:polysaccharide biosynthesis tyrosine autokinase [Billgrantia kenyensis]|uniref:Polysaccharide biosynthesis tyrosine autokinase n=1 Tax=Billgrantia kenyensis TaxID=321266 RepID=A0A7V9W089_9GAMM|nr:polysaccharide biosynthesis tyrosine autokinase [Halomonas kenyensis]MBA2778683.1 polysaccharide biosynthesis tyrosine autokinase [Halomonas kenyensis]MCG6661745.1 polysaccharide biosynthesis tyrosine autokinase [Halomonas kenyensis]